jgi:hypothetical protein
VLIYVRAFDTEQILIVLNLGATRIVLASNAPKGIVLVSTSGKREGDFIDLNVQLDANEGLVVRLASDVDISSIESNFRMAPVART